MSRTARVDQVDRRIVAALQRDGRRPFTSIAKELGLSEAAVRQRVQRLVDSGVVQIVAVTDPLELGFARSAMIAIRVDGPTAPVADALAAIDEVIYVVITAGRHDIIAEVVARSDEDLLIMTERIRDIPGIRSTETLVYLSLRKEIYYWGR